MPIKLVPPRAGKTPYWYGRGSYLGIAIDRSTKTSERRVAKIVVKRWEREIERGEYQREPEPQPVVNTFLAAAVAYMQAGGERKYLGPIIEMTGPHALRDMPIEMIDQPAIDRAAAALFPRATAQTKNRQFYTPVSAVLKRAGVEKGIKRPKGWRGGKSTSWLEPEQAFAAFQAADSVDVEFGLFLRTLLYGGGMRLSEGLRPKLREVNLDRAAIYLPKTKNGEARTVHLPPELVVALANHPRGLDRNPDERLFRFHAGGRLRDMLKETWRRAGLSFPRRQGGFHIFCHTYGTWMRRYAGLDNFDLTRTERWKDPRSAERYLHTDVNEEARMADLLPTENRAAQAWTGCGNRRRIAASD